ncbi:site-specific integrase [Hymenobacter busanensis]|uniref:Site-specific integrase n=1 Tax=Hymenobacter busanensis TaxID=2607656 RepID=A0A7L4ZZ91_9BACT|nr:site-specific integrase [Hymenobacter busanensis]KAA9338730.1 site-specific integrase [Hymenobacter busanensis]QHJ08839.1 tyrosine-type recombinase/integrase [Hymenobacter busanensis]
MSKTTEHKEGQATVRIIYKVGKTLADGSHPFLVRITKDRKQIYRSTGLSLHPKYWNAKKQDVRRSYPEPQRTQLLQELHKWELKYAEAARALAVNDERHDAGTVLVQAAEERRKLRRVYLLAFTDELVADMLQAGQVGNATVYRDLRNQLFKFIQAEFGVDDVPFERVTVAFCNRWETALRASGKKEITLSLRFRTLRAVLNKAIANGDARLEHYPFARTAAERHKFSVGKFDVSTAKRAISREALRRLEALTPATERLQRAKNVFLFSFYCGGINFVDLAQLRWCDLAVGETGEVRLRYERQKTGGKFVFKLVAPAAGILNFYRSVTSGKPEQYIFPILDVNRHRSASQIKNRLHKILAQVNQDLKALAAEAGIAIPLTTYVARHSFATSLKKGGVATSLISEALGHKSETVTAIYLDSFDADALDSVFDCLL